MPEGTAKVVGSCRLLAVASRIAAPSESRERCACEGVAGRLADGALKDGSDRPNTGRSGAHPNAIAEG